MAIILLELTLDETGRSLFHNIMLRYQSILTVPRFVAKFIAPPLIYN